MVKALAIFVALIFSVGGAFAATMETGSDASVPAVVTDTSRPRYCTIAYVTVDSATNDVFMARMEVDPAQTDQAANGLYPCPRDIPARLATRALEPCLSRVVDGYEPREGQRRMAEAIASVIDESGILLAEAGTGTGKTLAYLIPAILSRQRVLVSTGTKNLQEQIYFKDLPVLREALGLPVTPDTDPAVLVPAARARSRSTWPMATPCTSITAFWLRPGRSVAALISRATTSAPPIGGSSPD